MRKTNDVEKKASKDRCDSDTEVAEEIVEMELKQEEIALSKQTEKEKLIAQIYQMMGRIQAAGLFEKVAVTATFIWMKQVKLSKIYREISEIGSWKNFCNLTGYSRRYVDEQIQNLDAFGEKLLEVFRQLSLSHKDLRKLRKSISKGEMIIDGEHVVIGERRIPITSDHSEDLQAAIESIIEERNRKIEDQAAKLKTKDRILEEKERKIQRQEKDLIKFEREIKTIGLPPDEKDFIQEMEKVKTMIAGLELKMDPRNIPEEFTPLMASAYIETLGHAVRTFKAYYDDATSMYGDPDIDDDWIPPHLRSESIDQNNGE